MAVTKPLVGRMVLLSKLDETVVNGKRFMRAEAPNVVEHQD